jgi:hypothetical protein
MKNENKTKIYPVRNWGFMLGLCGLFEFVGCRLFSIGLYDNNEAFLIFGFIFIAIGFWLGLVGIKNLIVEANVKSLEIFHWERPSYYKKTRARI